MKLDWPYSQCYVTVIDLQELASLSTKLTKVEWLAVVERMCEVAGIATQKQAVQDLYAK